MEKLPSTSLLHPLSSYKTHAAPAQGIVNILCIIPIFNEAKSLRKLMEDFQLAMKRCSEPYRILAIDDGSTDESLELLQSFQETLPLQIKAIGRKGLSEVFRTALAASWSGKDEDVLVIMEGDSTCSPFCIPYMAEKTAEGADIIICSRFRPGGGMEDVPLLRKVGSRMANALLRQAFPYPNLTDYTIFFRCYRVGFLKKLREVYAEKLLNQNGFAVNAELLLKSLVLKPVVEEMPYLYPYGRKLSKSKFKILPTCYDYLLLLSERIFATS